jgi:hypothetical protein
MLLLTSVDDIIQIVTDVSCTLAVHASWVDRDEDADTPGRTNTLITTATTTTIVAAPGADTVRNVRFLSICNTHASTSVNVIVEHFDDTNAVQLYRISVPAGCLVTHSEGKWTLFDSAGSPILSPLNGRYLGTTVLTSSSGTFTTGPQTRAIFIRGVGGGAGGAGCTSVGSAASAGGGGGAGGYVEKYFLVSAGTGYAYVCGAAGTGASGALGGNGGDSTFIVGGVTVTAQNGVGAPVATALTTLSSYIGGIGGTVSTNGDVNSSGQPGENGHVVLVATPLGVSGAGGSGPFGGGGVGKSSVGNGNVGIGYGAGGGGAFTGASTVRTGGDGTAGCWIVDEYA